MLPRAYAFDGAIRRRTNGRLLRIIVRRRIRYHNAILRPEYFTLPSPIYRAEPVSVSLDQNKKIKRKRKKGKKRETSSEHAQVAVVANGESSADIFCSDFCRISSRI